MCSILLRSHGLLYLVVGGGKGGKRDGLIYMEKEEEAPSALLKVEKDKNKEQKE